MNIYLKEIDKSNWEKCILLTTNKDNIHYLGEEFIASNAYSIVQSNFENGWITKAIYDENTMVGFTMYGYCYEDNLYEISRIMIDHKYQGKGYGKAALGKVIEEMKSFKDCNEIFLSFDQENQIGKKLYESFNFKDTGKIIDGELLYSLSLK
ncbi:diamine N-acetyltransferase [Clostridium cavendishii DSM 21758]|uniref:Diamine N-acetyltransferase n=1 Tax=Clostridium cavendishii DSM 21758 TaxID=1121302 RepID=A0A1M6GM82_9CLOT|nr:GNAT family N-acetyltransferase [Clostridium cavendishii]SHJ11059.1 diamine N-acetyltransferase [Clostridium cavendishii DSM 21758]